MPHLWILEEPVQESLGKASDSPLRMRGFGTSSPVDASDAILTKVQIAWAKPEVNTTTLFRKFMEELGSSFGNQ